MTVDTNRMIKDLGVAWGALLGPGAACVTIDAMESFGNFRGDARIEGLSGEPARGALRDALEACCVDAASHRHAHRGAIEITRSGCVVDPCEFRGPVRLRLRPHRAGERG